MLNLDAPKLALEVSRRVGLELSSCAPPPNVTADVVLGSVDPPPERGLCVFISFALGRLSVGVHSGIFAQGLLTAVGRGLAESSPALLALARHLVSEGFEVTIGSRSAESLESLGSAEAVFPVAVVVPYFAPSAGDPDRLQFVTDTVVKALTVALIAVPHAVGGSVTGVSGEVEGQRIHELSVRIERSRANRMACIAIHGLGCAACGMRMSDRYGELARDLVEVHHLHPLASLDVPRSVDPRSDLVPLCPNCHRVAHLVTPPLLPSQIRESLISSRGPSAVPSDS